MKAAKEKLRIQKRLGEIRKESGRCRTCGATSGLKTAREASGLRCVECIRDGRTCPEVEEYERLKERLEKLNRRNG